MKVTITVELPDLTDDELRVWQSGMKTMAGYYYKDVIATRSASMAKQINQSVEFELDAPQDEGSR